MPERALRLAGPSLEIVTRCDGNIRFQKSWPTYKSYTQKRSRKKVEQDILGYLQLLRDQRALDFAS